MEELDNINSLIEMAKELQANGKKWHFHMLIPNCKFNDKNDKHAFVLENESDNLVYVVYSDIRYMEQGKELVKLIYGDKILEKEHSSKQLSDSIKPIIERERSLNEKGVLWHHHMLFPNCIFNNHKGKWNIVFEDPEEEKVLESVTDGEPIEDLRAVEILYYAQKK